VPPAGRGEDVPAAGHPPRAGHLHYGLGIFSLATPCGTVWGHNGDFPGYYSNAYTTLGGSRQVIVLINTDSSSLTTRQDTDLSAAIVAGLCGHP
jgi:D-alanyl-D-alanine carboxypeptidase